MQNDSIIRPTENAFGVKGENLTHWANRPQRNTPTTETRVVCTERKFTLIRVSCGRVEGTKTKTARDGRTSPLCAPHPPLDWQAANLRRLVSRNFAKPQPAEKKSGLAEFKLSRKTTKPPEKNPA